MHRSNFLTSLAHTQGNNIVYTYNYNSNRPFSYKKEGMTLNI